MKKFLSLVLTLYVSSFVYTPPPKQAKGNMPPESPHKYQQQMKHDFDKLIKELNITTEQQEKMRDMMQSDISRKKELRQEIRQKMDAIDEELLKEKVDMNTINKLSQEIQQLNAEISKINIESKLKVRSTLTFDQYTKMEQNRKSKMINSEKMRNVETKDKANILNKKAQKIKK